MIRIDRRTRWVATAAVVLSIGITPWIPMPAAAADPAKLLETCHADDEKPQVREAACTSIIDDKSSDSEARVEALIQRGVIRAELEDKAGAVADYTAAIDLDPNNEVAYYNRAMGQLELDKPDQALADLDKAIALGMNEAEVWAARGMANEALGKIEAALADYDKAAKLDANNEEAKEALARLRKK